jgi:hypothetical protein
MITFCIVMIALLIVVTVGVIVLISGGELILLPLCDIVIGIIILIMLIKAIFKKKDK